MDFLLIIVILNVVFLNQCSTQLTEKQINELVSAHNDFRSLTASGSLDGQPKATNMQKMVKLKLIIEF